MVFILNIVNPNLNLVVHNSVELEVTHSREPELALLYQRCGQAPPKQQQKF